MNMRQKHTIYYVSLSIIMALGLLVIVLTKQDPVLRMYAVLLTTLFYVVWGIVHHILHHDTSVRVVVEYVLIGALGIVLALLSH